MSYSTHEVRAFTRSLFARLSRWAAYSWPDPPSLPVPPRESTLTQEQRIRAGRLFARGATVHEVAQRTGAHWTEIARWRRR